MEPILANRKLSAVVYGDEVDLDPVERADKDNEAKEIINSSLESRVMKKVLTATSARALWTQLRGHYEREGDGSLESSITAFCNLKMADHETITDYIGRVEEIFDRVRNLGEPLSERLVIIKIVSGLTKKYEVFQSVWNSVSNKTYTGLIDMLNKTECDLNQRESRHSRQPTAFLSKKTFPKKRNAKEASSRIEELKKKTKCRNCGQVGHWKRECPSNNTQ